jgi:hypothetical protein
MHANPNSPTTSNSTNVTGLERPKVDYPSTSYQKILDYRVTEILLTIIFGVIVLLRLRH